MGKWHDLNTKYKTKDSCKEGTMKFDRKKTTRIVIEIREEIK